VFIDPRDVAQDSTLSADVCIIGAGPAGLALFFELERKGIDVCLLESGDLDPDARAQSLCDGDSADGAYPFLESRVRAFGGTTHLWSGVCASPDPLDFNGDRGSGLGGWPLSYEELRPYLARAYEFFGVPEGPGSVHRDDIAVHTLRFPRARLRLGPALHRDASDSRRGRVLLRTTATEVLCNESGSAAEGVSARTLDGRSLVVRANRTVLAGGGIECARLLLDSRSHCPNGLGNDHDLVGRGLMERRHVIAGELDVADERSDLLKTVTNRRPVPGGQEAAAVSLTSRLRTDEDLLACWARFYRLHSSERSEAVAAHQRLWAALATRERPHRLKTALGEMARDPLSLMSYYSWRVARRLAPSAASPGRTLVAATVEQEPDLSNRVGLSDRKDLFGRPLAYLELSHSEAYRSSFERSVKLLSERLEAAKLGRLIRSEDESHWPRKIRSKYGYHPMGTTRMGDDPTRSVVDRNCAVHGVANLSVASSSVFPVAGSANPTITIVALALRLADHLASRLR